MAIVTAEIKLYLSGGGANSDPNASLGGAISTTEVDDVTTLHNLFDKVTSDETTSGAVEYRCVYIKNTNATLTWEAVKAWVDSNTPSADTTLAIGLGSSAINGTEQTVADEVTAPVGVTFSEPANKAAGLTIGDIPNGQHKAIWLRRTVNAGSSAYNNDGATLGFSGDTAA